MIDRVNKMKKHVLRMIAATAAVLFCGCNSIDYVGQRFEPLKPHQEVKFYRFRDQMPKDKYTLIGRAKISFRDKADIYHVRKEAVTQARAVGADAFCVVDMEYVHRGVYAHNKDEFGSVHRTVGHKDPDFGMEVPLRGEHSTMRFVEAKVLFFKNSSDVKALNKLQ